jgi:hypothetical protein
VTWRGFAGLLDEPSVLRAVGWSLPMATFLGALAAVALSSRGLGVALGGGVLAFASGVLVIAGGTLAVTHVAANAGGRLLMPSGSSTRSQEEFSREQALVARGEVREALALLRDRLSGDPSNVHLCLFAAEVHARDAGDAEGAEALFRRVQEQASASAAQDLHATNRLLDLYLGPLDSRTRAEGQLRRLLERHPGSRAAKHAEHLLRNGL